MIREKVKNLWKLCFNDSEEFTELYFRLRYNNDINIAIQSGEEVIAALQMLPYPMTFEGEDIHTAYISGACTHPDYRNRGVMHELLSQAFARMLHNNVALSTGTAGVPTVYPERKSPTSSNSWQTVPTLWRSVPPCPLPAPSTGQACLWGQVPNCTDIRNGDPRLPNSRHAY